MQANPTLSHCRQAEIQQEALTRAVTGQSYSNYPAIIRGFAAKGIPEDAIKPRENVFTYEAWRALGRYVRTGEPGIKVATVRTFQKKVRDRDSGEERIESYSVPWTATVFHISQTAVCQ
jgi:antirestriction protein ArdC